MKKLNSKKTNCIYFTLIFVLHLFTANAQTAGSIDTTFNSTDKGFGKYYSWIFKTALQNDGKIIIGGYGAYYCNGMPFGNIARLNANGTLDTTFHTGVGFEPNPTTGYVNVVDEIIIQSDGKIIVGGSFISYNGITVNGIARLNPNGTLDITFSSGTGFNSTSSNGAIVQSISIDNGGKIIIGGDFTSYNGVLCKNIVRLQSNGWIDGTFNVGAGANGAISTTAIQNDGKIIIGGSFTNYNVIPCNHIARLNTNGTLDTTFIIGIGANGAIYTSAIQSDGKIIIGGSFTNYNVIPFNRIARLNTNGTLDTTFIIGTGANGPIYTSAIQSDGKIIIGGEFQNYNGISSNNIARINTNGALDNTFTIGIGIGIVGGSLGFGGIYATAIQSDGKIIIGGDFTNASGSQAICRVNSNGSLDVTFLVYNGGAISILSPGNVNVYSSLIQPDGKIIIGGNFTIYNGISCNRIARLNTNGTLDTTFTIGSGASGDILATAIQSDGKIIIGGNFVGYNGFTGVNRIARLNTDGTLDATFNMGLGADQVVRAIALQNDGKIIIGGNFTIYNGTLKPYLVRINQNGTLDATFNVGSGFDGSTQAIAIQSDGKIIIGGQFYTYNGISSPTLVRLNTNGTLDATFNVGTGATINNVNAVINGIRSIVLQSDGKIIIGGNFGFYNGISGKSIARINTNGSYDSTFSVGFGATSIAGGFANVYKTAIQNDGKIIIGGTFNKYNGVNMNGIARLNTNGTLDTTFVIGSGTSGTGTGGVGIKTAAIQSDGKIIIGGSFDNYNGIGRNNIARINGDSFITNMSSYESNDNNSIYPNPNNGLFTINLLFPSKIVVTNIMGQTIVSETFKTGMHNLDIHNNVAGIYFVTITQKNKQQTIKIIKQ